VRQSTLVGIAEDAVVTEIDLSTRCTELTASETAIWGACPIDGVAVTLCGSASGGLWPVWTRRPVR
jgi:hypothetical protein